MKNGILRAVAIATSAAFVLLTGSMFAAAGQPSRLICDNWPPYEYRASGTMTGFSVEMIQAVYTSMDVPIESITPYPWKRALEILEHGYADALFSANHTPERAEYARYPKEPLLESPWIIWTQGTAPVTSLEELKGKRIGVVLGYSYTPEFWAFIKRYCNVEQVALDETNFKKLERGRIDATVAEYGNGLHYIKQFKLKTVKPQPTLEIKRAGLYIIFNRKLVTKSFVDEFSRHLQEFKATEAYQELWERYFDRQLPF